MCHVDGPVEEWLVCGFKGDVFFLRSHVSLPLGQSEAVSSPVSYDGSSSMQCYKTSEEKSQKNDLFCQPDQTGRGALSMLHTAPPHRLNSITVHRK